ncbi:hypothetical protein [Rhizobium sp. P44RR-XXIV]|nr:hypothetical protein [Rhizobium sp. P44RR-XXIV]
MALILSVSLLLCVAVAEDCWVLDVESTESPLELDAELSPLLLLPPPLFA